MAEGLVLPKDIDLNWAKENPAQGTDVEPHLEAYTAMRSQWANQTAESWAAQYEALAHIAQADSLLRDESIYGDELRPTPRLMPDAVRAIPVEGLTANRYLGRTSLFEVIVSEIGQYRHQTLDFEDIYFGNAVPRSRYSHGIGNQAQLARQSADSAITSAKDAAHNIAADDTIPELTRAIWSVLLTHSGYSQLDPESYYEHATDLLKKSKFRLEKEDWFVRFTDYHAHALLMPGSPNSNPFAVSDDGVVVNCEVAFASRFANVHSDIRRGIPFDDTYADLELPVEDNSSVGLVTAEQLTDNPTTSFPTLRRLAGPARNYPRHISPSDILYTDDDFELPMEIVRTQGNPDFVKARFAAAHLAIQAIGGTRANLSELTVDSEVLSQINN